jgi:hypothetical protein
MKKLIISCLTIFASLGALGQIDTAKVTLRLAEDYIYFDTLSSAIQNIRSTVRYKPTLDFSTLANDWESKNNFRLNTAFKTDLSAKYYAFSTFLALSCDARIGNCLSSTPAIDADAILSYLDQYKEGKKMIKPLEGIWMDKIGKAKVLTTLAYLNQERPHEFSYELAAYSKELPYTAKWYDERYSSSYPTSYSTILIKANVDTFIVKYGMSVVGYTYNKQVSIQVPLRKETVLIISKEGYDDYTMPEMKFEQVISPYKEYPVTLRRRK